jgi:hypothetical protein
LAATAPLTLTNDGTHLTLGADLFPDDTLVLGKWRIRGNNSGEFYLERLDDDGAIVTDAWYPVATFGFNTEINSPGMAIDNLGVAYNLTAGNLAVAGSITNGGFPVLTTNTGYTKAQVDTSLNGKQNKLTTASIVDVDELTCWNKLETNILTGRNVAQVTVQDNLKVTQNAIIEGSLDVATDINVNSVFASGPITSTGLLTNSVICNGNMSIIGGNLIGYNPFWVAGRVNGTTLQILGSKGRYGFTVTRPSGFPTGVYKITFNTPAPDANYVISLAQFANGNIKVWDSTDAPGRIPATTSFHVISYNTSWTVANLDFWFSIFV